MSIKSKIPNKMPINAGYLNVYQGCLYNIYQTNLTNNKRIIDANNTLYKSSTSTQN